jgi:hypothetical protein
VHNILPSRLLPGDVNIEILKIVILPIVLYCVKFWAYYGIKRSDVLLVVNINIMFSGR